MKISVVIPSYKPKEYLQVCLQSLERQTIEKTLFEVILVLNGCKEPYYSEIECYVQKSELNVVLVQTDTPGVSNARNIALDRTRGEYITFLDDDDWISPSYLSELYELAETGYVPLSNIKAFKDKTNVELPYYITDIFNRYCNNHIRHNILQIRSFMSVPCCKLIRKEVIGKRRFNTRFKNGEDSLFMFLISNKMVEFKFTSSNAIYYRRVRENSAVTQKKTLKEKIMNSFHLCIAYSKIYWSDIRSYNFMFYIMRILASVKNVFEKSSVNN